MLQTSIHPMHTTVPAVVRKEGFLASSSVIQLGTVLVRAYGYSEELPPFLTNESADPLFTENSRSVLVLTSPAFERRRDRS